MVPIIITGRNGKVNSVEKEHAKDKIEKLEKYFNGINRIEVILDKTPEGSRAEVVISVKRGGQIVCQCSDKDLYAAIDLVLDKAEVQLTRHKEKVQSRRAAHKLGESLEGGEEPPGDESLETYDDVIEKRDFE